MDRPTGVTVLGVLAIIGGAGAIALALLLMLGSDFLFQKYGVAVVPVTAIAGVAVLGGLVFLLFGVFQLVLAIGLLNLANWARILTIVCAAIGLVSAALGVSGALIHFFPVLMMRRLIMGAIDALIIWYLSQPHVKQAFSPQTTPQAPIAPSAPAPPLPPAAV